MPMAVANRYARALADALGPNGDYRKVLLELQDFETVYRESLELREIFDSPAVALPQKVKVLEAISRKLDDSPVTLIFLRVLLANYRMPLLEEVVQAYRKIANDRTGVVQVTISSASNLSEAEREALASRFRELTRKQVELEFRIDSELLGGILAQIGSTVYDGSVRGNLARIREQLTAR
ncbi:MAG: ATP synthase F1 subunit delta [Terriglobia bacterium]